MAKQAPGGLMTIAAGQPVVTWEPLPADFQLNNEPVDNLSQPLLANALTEALELAGRLQPTMLIGTNLGVCAHWLRWWDQSGQMLFWGTELVEQQQQQIERMAARLRELGANPDEI